MPRHTIDMLKTAHPANPPQPVPGWSAEALVYYDAHAKLAQMAAGIILDRHRAAWLAERAREARLAEVRQ